jgi:hypothetical protein
MGKRKPSSVELHSGHHPVVFDLTPDGLHLYTSCCGARVPRRKAKALRKLLTKWLAGTKSKGGR